MLRIHTCRTSGPTASCWDLAVWLRGLLLHEAGPSTPRWVKPPASLGPFSALNFPSNFFNSHKVEHVSFAILSHLTHQDLCLNISLSSILSLAHGKWKWRRKSLSRAWLYNSMDCRLSGSSVHGIFQARILEWVATPFSRASSRSRDRTQVSCITGRFFIVWATREAQKHLASLPAGSQAPASHMTGKDTHHYTNEEAQGRC